MIAEPANPSSLSLTPASSSTNGFQSTSTMCRDKKKDTEDCDLMDTEMEDGFELMEAELGSVENSSSLQDVSPTQRSFQARMKALKVALNRCKASRMDNAEAHILLKTEFDVLRAAYLELRSISHRLIHDNVDKAAALDFPARLAMEDFERLQLGPAEQPGVEFEMVDSSGFEGLASKATTNMELIRLQYNELQRRNNAIKDLERHTIALESERKEVAAELAFAREMKDMKDRMMAAPDSESQDASHLRAQNVILRHELKAVQLEQRTAALPRQDLEASELRKQLEQAQTERQEAQSKVNKHTQIAVAQARSKMLIQVGHAERARDKALATVASLQKDHAAQRQQFETLISDLRQQVEALEDKVRGLREGKRRLGMALLQLSTQGSRAPAFGLDADSARTLAPDDCECRSGVAQTPSQ